MQVFVSLDFAGGLASQGQLDATSAAELLGLTLVAATVLAALPVLAQVGSMRLEHLKAVVARDRGAGICATVSGIMHARLTLRLEDDAAICLTREVLLALQDETHCVRLCAASLFDNLAGHLAAELLARGRLLAADLQLLNGILGKTILFKTIVSIDANLIYFL